MTSYLIEDTARRLRRAQVVLAVMLGITVAGFWSPSVAFFSLAINGIAWGSWWLTIARQAHQLRGLEITQQRIEEDVSRV